MMLLRDYTVPNVNKETVLHGPSLKRPEMTKKFQVFQLGLTVRHCYVFSDMYLDIPR